MDLLIGNHTGGISIQSRDTTRLAVIGVAEHTTSIYLDIFPNPASRVIFLRISGKELHLEFTKLLGEKILSQKVSGNLSLNVTDLPDGLYFISLRSDNSIISRKLLIQR